MPKERIYGKPYGSGTHDVVVSFAKEQPDKNGDGIVFVSVLDQTADDTNAMAHLDRVGVNRLIQKLRRARDAAYGADA